MTHENHSLVVGESPTPPAPPVPPSTPKNPTPFHVQQGSATSTPTSGYTISEAAALLYVSERTIRRYVQGKKLLSFQSGGQTMVERASLDGFIQKFHPELTKLHTKTNRSPQPSQSQAQNNPTPATALTSAEPKPTEPKSDETTRIYRHLYENTLTKLTEAQKRLEGANYRVGELENQLKNTVPLLDYTRTQTQLKELEGSVERFQREANESAEINHRLVKEYSEVKDQYSLAKAKGYFYLILLIAILIAGSFWLVLQHT